MKWKTEKTRLSVYKDNICTYCCVQWKWWKYRDKWKPNTVFQITCCNGLMIIWKDFQIWKVNWRNEISAKITRKERDPTYTIKAVHWRTKTNFEKVKMEDKQSLDTVVNNEESSMVSNNE